MRTGISRFLRFQAFAAASALLVSSGCCWNWKSCLVRHEPYGCRDCDYVSRHANHRPINVWQFTPCDDLWKDHCEQAAARGSRQHSDCTVCNEAAFRGLEQHYTPAIEDAYEMPGKEPAARPLTPSLAEPTLAFPPVSPPMMAPPGNASPSVTAPPTVVPIPAPSAASPVEPTIPAPVEAPPKASEEASPAIEPSAIEAPPKVKPQRPVTGPPASSPLAGASEDDISTTIGAPIETPKNALPTTNAAKESEATTPTAPSTTKPAALSEDLPTLPDAHPAADSHRDVEADIQVAPKTDPAPATESIELPRNELPSQSSIRLLAPANRTAVKRKPTSGESSSRRGYR